MQNQYPVNTMQTDTCPCPSFSSGLSYGIGFAVGIGLIAGFTAGIITLLKKR